MDTSPEYVKMCEKATGIQDAWNPNAEGDVFFIQAGLFTNGKEPGNGETIYEKGEIVFCGDGVCPYNDYPLGQVRQDGSRFSYDDGKYIWLPRQDQLQEMLENADFYNDLRSLMEWTRKGPSGEDWRSDYSSRFKSAEQLWLAFVMHEKYNKVWNGSEWREVHA